MRSELIFTNFRCNQNCTYCTYRRASDDLSAIRTSAIRAEVERAIAAGAREIVFSGGEPTMRGDLAGLVAYARDCGAERVCVETNGTLIDSERASELFRAGLTLARVNMTHLGSELDHITRDPGGAQLTESGIRALAGSGIPIEISLVLIRSNIDSVEEFPAHFVNLAGSIKALRGLIIRVPTRSPDPSEILSYERVAPAIVGLERAAREHGLSLKIAPDQSVPPCVFAQTLRVAHLFSLTPGSRRRPGHVQIEACSTCQVSDRCSGFSEDYLDLFGVPGFLEPISEDRVRRRLSLISGVEEQVRRELVQPNRYTSRLTGEEVQEALIRVNFHCNQSCRFCFVSTHLPSAEDQVIRRAIVEAGEAGRQITITGGEPTLNGSLLAYIELARAHSGHVVSLQTNAVRLADRELTRQVVEAGVGFVQVSLHGSHAELSDSITEAPGTFEKTIVGVDNLHEHEDLALTINFVICQRNFTDLPAFVRFVAARWPRAFLNISFVAASSDVVPKEKALMPSYTDVLPHLFDGLEEARRLGVDFGGFESMCGIPLCLVPTEKRWFLMQDIPEGYDGGEFVKPSVCSDCNLKRKCYGLRRGYHDLYGAGELCAVGEEAGHQAQE